MRSTGDIQFFVCRSRIIPEPPFPCQRIAGSGNEIEVNAISDTLKQIGPSTVSTSPNLAKEGARRASNDCRATLSLFS